MEEDADYHYTDVAVGRRGRVALIDCGRDAE